MASRWPPGLLILDTLSQVKGEADITSPKDAGIVLRNLRLLQDLGFTVLFIHHTGHLTTRPTGAKDLSNACDVVIRLTKPKSGSVISLEVTKNRDRESGAKLSGRLVFEEVNGHLVPVYQPDSTPPSDGVPTREARSQADPAPVALDAAVLLASMPGADAGVSNKAWQDAAGKTEGAFRPVRLAAVATELVHVDGEGRQARYSPLYDAIKRFRGDTLTAPQGVGVDAGSDGGGRVAETRGHDSDRDALTD